MTTTILLLLNLAVYFSIVGVVVAEEVIRRKVIRNKGLSKKQQKDIDKIEKYEKSKTLNKTKAVLKNQNKLNTKKFRYKLAKHVLKAAKKKRFVFNRRYTISELTTKDPKMAKDVRKASLHEAYADYYEQKSELKSGRKARKYATKSTTHREKAQRATASYPKEQKNSSFYERTIDLPDGETYTDHRTSINCHDARAMNSFKQYVQANYTEPKHHRPTILEMNFNGVNKTSVTSPSAECLEYGRIMLMQEALELARSSEFSSAVFPIRIMQADTKAGKTNEGRVKAVEVARYENISELTSAIVDAQTDFSNKYSRKESTPEMG